jgi:FtsZ-binding cell division protein ZapB
MRCPNHCDTEEKLTRSTLQDHIDNNCPEQVSSCQFAEAGCAVRVKRKEMTDHIQQSVGEHMSYMMDAYMKLKEEYSTLQNDHNSLKKDHDSLKRDNDVTKKRLAVLEKSKAKR